MNLWAGGLAVDESLKHGYPSQTGPGVPHPGTTTDYRRATNYGTWGDQTSYLGAQRLLALKNDSKRNYWNELDDPGCENGCIPSAKEQLFGAPCRRGCQNKMASRGLRPWSKHQQNTHRPHRSSNHCLITCSPAMDARSSLASRRCCRGLQLLTCSDDTSDSVECCAQARDGRWIMDDGKTRNRRT